MFAHPQDFMEGPNGMHVEYPRRVNTPLFPPFPLMEMLVAGFAGIEAAYPPPRPITEPLTVHIHGYKPE